MQLVRALLNPTRIRILDAVAESPASSRQLVARLGESPSVVSYHVGVLRSTGCLRPTEAEQTGPGDERVYELAPLATPTRRLAQEQMAPSAPGHPPAAVLRTIVDRVSGLEANTPAGGDGNHLSCFSVVLDQRGWQEVSAAIGNVVDRVSAAHEESSRRLADAEEKGIATTFAVASFGPPTA